MDSLSSRVVDYEPGDNNSPLPNLNKTPLVSLQEAVDAARADPSLADEDLTINVKAAMRFAKNHKLSKHPAGEHLSLDELACIQIYTQESPLYRIINERLRDRDRTKAAPCLPFIRLYLTALYKLPPCARTLYRGVKRNLQGAFVTGAEKVWWAFSSTTCKVDVLQNDLFLGKTGDRTMFNIVATHAYDISAFSAIASEAEFLLPPNTELEVEGVLDAGHGLVIVQLKQLPYTPLLSGVGGAGGVGGGGGAAAAAASASPAVGKLASTLSSSSLAFPASPVAGSGTAHAPVPRPTSARVSLDGKSVSSIVAAMFSNPQDPILLGQACAALGELVKANQEVAKEVRTSGALALAVGAIREHAAQGEHVGLMLQGLTSSIRREKHSIQAVWDLDGVDVVLMAMKMGEAKALVQAMGCFALAILCSMIDDNKPLVAQRGGVEAVVAAMRAHAGSVDVQHYGCWALMNIASHPDNQALMAQKGGIEVVVAAMRAHLQSVDVQHYGCRALASIVGHPDNKPLVAQKGGIEAVVAAMRAHAGNVDVQHYGCWALVNIAFHPENKPLVAQKGGIEAVVAAMRAHASSVDVQHYGCRALVSIGWSSTSIQQQIRDEGAVALARKALAAHASHAGVVEKSKELLQELGQ